MCERLIYQCKVLVYLGGHAEHPWHQPELAGNA